MNYLKIKFFMLAAFMILAAGFEAYAEDFSCSLNAPTRRDVWVIVYEADGDGNRNQELLRGKIEAGKQAKIKTGTGYIRYNYKLEQDQPYSGDFDRWCDNGEQIQLP